jgi:hypothetical protein
MYIFLLPKEARIAKNQDPTRFTLKPKRNNEKKKKGRRFLFALLASFLRIYLTGLTACE